MTVDIIVNFGHILRSARAVAVAESEFEAELEFGTAESTIAAFNKRAEAQAHHDSLIKLALDQDTTLYIN